MPFLWCGPVIAVVLLGHQRSLQSWQPKGAPEFDAVFSVTYQEQGHPYVDETYRVDLTGLKKLWSQSQGKASPLELLRSGQVCSSVQMRFLVDIGGPKRRSLVERNLRAAWPTPDYPGDSPEIQSYLDWQGRELNYGDRVDYCFIQGKALHIRFNEGPGKRFTSPPLMQALRTIEFTDDPEDPGAMAGLEAALLRLLR